MRFANHCMLFVFAFNTALELFQSQICKYLAKLINLLNLYLKKRQKNVLIDINDSLVI